MNQFYQLLAPEQLTYEQLLAEKERLTKLTGELKEHIKQTQTHLEAFNAFYKELTSGHDDLSDLRTEAIIQLKSFNEDLQTKSNGFITLSYNIQPITYYKSLMIYYKLRAGESLNQNTQKLSLEEARVKWDDEIESTRKNGMKAYQNLEGFEMRLKAIEKRIKESDKANPFIK